MILTSPREEPDLVITSHVLDVKALVAERVELAGFSGAFKMPGVVWAHVSERPPNEVT